MDTSAGFDAASLIDHIEAAIMLLELLGEMALAGPVFSGREMIFSERKLSCPLGLANHMMIEVSNPE